MNALSQGGWLCIVARAGDDAAMLSTRGAMQAEEVLTVQCEQSTFLQSGEG